MDELKPCPCCGCRAVMRQAPLEPETSQSGGYYIECTGCHLTTLLMFSILDNCKPLLVGLWNRRPVTVSEGEAEKVLREAKLLRDRINSANDLHAVFTIKDSAEFLGFSKAIDAYLKGKP